uniref:Uncharacterized protein n=1 Tax=Romanomermis culicivorax TaxID=13658 RepID=A0A915J1Q9_ROMCU
MIRIIILALLLVSSVDRSYQRTRHLVHDSPLVSLKQEAVSTADPNVDDEENDGNDTPITPPSDLIEVAPRKQPLAAAIVNRSTTQTESSTTEKIDKLTPGDSLPNNIRVNNQPSVAQQIQNVKHIVPDQPNPFRTSNNEGGNPDLGNAEIINEESVIHQPNVASIPSAPGFPPSVVSSQQQPFNVGLGPQLAPTSGQWSRTPNGLSRTALTVQDVEKLSGLKLKSEFQQAGGDDLSSKKETAPEIAVNTAPNNQNLSIVPLVQDPKQHLGAVNNSGSVVRQPFGIIERPVGPFGQIPQISATKQPANRFNLPPAQQPEQAKGIIVPRITADGISSQVVEQG